MKCRVCGSSNVRVTCTDGKSWPEHVRRYYRCLDCSGKFRTVEKYQALGTSKARIKPGPAKGTPNPAAMKIPRGIDHAGSVLLEENVHEIRRRAHRGDTHTSLAKEFGISRSYVGKLVAGSAWSHLETDLDPFPPT